MKRFSFAAPMAAALAALLLPATAPLALSQGNPFGGMGSGMRFDGPMGKLFGDHKAFVSNMEIEAKPADRPETISLATKFFFLDGKARTEIDLTKVKGGLMPPAMIDQLKSFGMAEMVSISQPGTPTLLVYPGLKSYAPVPEDSKPAAAADYTVASKELGKEAIDGDDCVKSQVTVSGAEGKKFEATVWTSARLKKFPVRIQSNDGNTPFTLTFRDVKFEKPATTLFDPPASFTKYGDAMTLMRESVMKRLGNGQPK